MFYTQKRIEETNYVDTKVRVGTELELNNSGVKHSTSWRLLSNADETIVLQDTDYAMSVFALDYHLHPISNAGPKVTNIKATINKEVHDLFFADDFLVYSKKVVTNPLRNVSIKRGDTIEVQRTIPAQFGNNIPDIEEWYPAEVIDVTSRQLLIKVLLNGEDEPEYISFYQMDTTTHDGDTYELHAINYSQEVKV